MQNIFMRLASLTAPVIHFGTGTSALLKVMKEAGGDVIGVDWRISLGRAAQNIGVPTPLQGNLDPAILLSGPAKISQRAEEIVAEGRALPGHIFNLGHGIYPETPIESVETLVRTVQASAAADKAFARSTG